jgi:hypothetical protein
MAHDARDIEPLSSSGAQTLPLFRCSAVSPNRIEINGPPFVHRSKTSRQYPTFRQFSVAKSRIRSRFEYCHLSKSGF